MQRKLVDADAAADPVRKADGLRIVNAHRVAEPDPVADTDALADSDVDVDAHGVTYADTKPRRHVAFILFLRRHRRIDAGGDQ